MLMRVYYSLKLSLCWHKCAVKNVQYIHSQVQVKRIRFVATSWKRYQRSQYVDTSVLQLKGLTMLTLVCTKKVSISSFASIGAVNSFLIRFLATSQKRLQRSQYADTRVPLQDFTVLTRAYTWKKASMCPSTGTGKVNSLCSHELQRLQRSQYVDTSELQTSKLTMLTRVNFN